MYSYDRSKKADGKPPAPPGWKEREKHFLNAVYKIREGISEYQEVMEALAHDHKLPPKVVEHAKKAIETAHREDEKWHSLQDDFHVMNMNFDD